MPRVVLQFEDRNLKEYDIGLTLTIGRLPDNMVVIDNPAVSGHHACIFRDGDHFIVEDLESTNGTFVNGNHVYRHTLQDGDVVLVGKHKLRFDQMGGSAVADADGPTIADLGDTVFLDTTKHRELLAKLREVRWAEAGIAAGAPRSGTAGAATTAASAKVGVLHVLAGRADQSEFSLEGRTSIIGKSEGALVRLRGWFDPQVALAIARNGETYVATPMAGKTLINNQPLVGRTDLKDGDLIQVSGLTLEFHLQD
jgi:pSer/pThr/pTyr-binding forkhead associated (FHA) protein